MRCFVFAVSIALLAVPVLPQAPAEAALLSQLDASPTLFYVLTAINAAGYDEQIDSSTNSPLRLKLRQYLAKQDLKSVPPLRRFVRDHMPKNRASQLSQYISFALLSKGAPDFTPAQPNLPQPADAEALYELPPLLAAFYQEANLAELWKQSQPDYDYAIAQFTGPVSLGVQQVNAYLRNVANGRDRSHFQIFVDLLGAPNQVHVRGYLDNYFVVVTPAAEPPGDEIRLAYLRFMSQPFLVRVREDLKRLKPLQEYALGSPILGQEYRDDFEALATESFARAVESRIERKPAMATDAMREGFVLAPAFADQLAKYEKQDFAMRLYFSDMLEGIDLKKEKQRLAKIDFVSERPVKIVHAGAVEKPPELTGVEKMLDDAEQLYLDRSKDPGNLARAKDMFQRVLRETDQKPMHAKAYYGLARIAVLERDPEAADGMFRKVPDLDADPATLSWSLVYIGKLADSQGEKDPAQEFYQKALAVKGISDAARQEAEKGVKGAFFRPRDKDPQ